MTTYQYCPRHPSVWVRATSAQFNNVPQTFVASATERDCLECAKDRAHKDLIGRWPWEKGGKDE